MISMLSLSWTATIYLTAVTLLAWEICWIVYCRTFHPLAKVPGPFLASFSRIWIWWTVRDGLMHTLQLALHAKHGKLVRIAPNELACSDPAAIKELYRNQNPLEKSDFYTTWSSSAFGKHKDHFSVINEKAHASQRRIVNHVYTLSNVLESESYVDECSRLFLRKLGDFTDDAQTLDLGKWLQMYAFDVIGEICFGRMFGFMESGKDYQWLIESLDVLNPIMASLAVSATYARPFILLSAIVSKSVRSALKALDHVTETSKAVVVQRENEFRAAEAGGKVPRQDMLQQLRSTVQEKGDKVDFGIADVQREAYAGLFAGSDPTAIAMRSVFYHLSRSPQDLSALRDELGNSLPTSDYPLQEPISYSVASKLPLLAATIKEAMRLHPSVAFTMPRVSPSLEGLTIDGIFIAPGYRVGVNAYVVQRNESVFGRDANMFRPGRWLPENSSDEQIKEMNRCMLSFGAGTRTCIGENISISELYKLIPYVLRNFDFVPVDHNEHWTHHNFWFNKQTGLMFQVKRRFGEFK